jgi:Family of unknown function (DUF6118)
MDLKVKTEPEGDPAAKAFIEMRNALAGMTMAVNKMAGEWNALEIPDYTETLGKMATNFETLAEELEELASRPALELTPEALAKQIATAGAAARKVEQQELASATATFVKLGREMAGFLASARTENEQNKWVLGFGCLCLAFGLIAATVLPGPIYRAMPESWHWPEKRAANVLDRDMWDAGERLQAVADPTRWKARTAIEAATVDSKESIAACLRAIARTSKPAECRIFLKRSGNQAKEQEAQPSAP